MKKAFTIKRIKVLHPHKLRITWSNGITAVLDLSDAVVRHRALAPLKDSRVFAKARIGEWGHSVRWTDDAELGAESLWRRTLEAIGRDDAARFIEWRLRNGLSLSRAADELGVSRRMVAYYETGKHKVPRTVLLACAGWETQSRKAA